MSIYLALTNGLFWIRSKEHKVTETLQNKSLRPEPLRALNPNVVQKQASDPAQSVWVSASAGTGKTKVLTDRVLRLLLPREDGSPGTDIHKILCLTFTKAAASEMMIRIQDTLGRWAVMPEGDEETSKTLCYELKNLLNRAPTAQDINAARQIFARVLEAPNGMQIMTIHAFCQSSLGRFPLEAGLTPYFSPLEDQQRLEYLQRAFQRIMLQARAEISSPLGQAYHHLSGVLNEQQFEDLMSSMISESSQLQHVQKTFFSALGLYESLCETFDIPSTKTTADLIKDAFISSQFNEDNLRKCCAVLATSKTKTDLKNAATLEKFLSASPQQKHEYFDAYCQIFLTAKDKIKANLVSKALIADNPYILDMLENEAERILNVRDRIKCLQSLKYTRDLFIFGLEVYQEYQRLKDREAVLDFDDLILKTLELLKEDMMAWVLYKLDQSLEHILIDEAQDTNPEQWQIIKALCDDFFSGKSANRNTRTLFTVGDHKQSIYSFQRASPKEFERMQAYFSEKIKYSEQKFQKISLNVSFRTTQTVLDIIDQTFASPAMQEGMGPDKVQHHSYRLGQAGHVELWPICATYEREEREPWSLPISINEHQTGSSELASNIARNIRSWIDNELFLPSRDRTVEPGDIMILVRTRTKFFDQLARELRKENIPLSGTDRIVLSNQIAIHDLISAANFALLPEDDYTLACLLKSPLIGFDEDQLFNICHERPGSLWEAIKNNDNKNLIDYLNVLIYNAKNLDTFNFFSSILYRPCPHDAQSGLKAFCERLGEDVTDDIEKFLEKSMDYDQDDPIHLQHFVHKMKSDQSDIKRAQEERSNKVQIMTIHGAKGLQAPIVILPDTIKTAGASSGKIDRRLLWPQQTQFKYPLWSPKSDFDFDAYKNLKSVLEDREQEEYRRLLYVAMTRSEDRLYICGHSSKKTPDTRSWYFSIKESMEAHPYSETTKDERIIIASPQIKNPDRTGHSLHLEEIYGGELPDFLFKPAPKEQPKGRILSPSSLLEDKEVSASPLLDQNNKRFRRGNLTHKLLEILPQLPEEKRESTAFKYLERFANDLNNQIRSQILNETINILNNSEFKAIFGPKSRSEVPITAHLPNGKTINGQIDRLLVNKTDIWIIDYKTNRPPPKNPEDVPKIYIEQMRAYKQALQKIYSAHSFHCALLWTDGPFLMPLEIESD